MYPAVYYRLVALLLLPVLLSGCSVYDHFFHPHRLGTPRMTASAKAKAKAAEKARHKGLTLGTSETSGADGSPASGSADGAAPNPAADTRSADDKNKAIAEMLGNTYDKKTGLLKRSQLQRMQYSSRALHHYDLRAPRHSDVTHDERKLRKYARHPKDKADPGEPAARASQREAEPDPTPPAPKAPAAKAAPQPAAAEPPAAGLPSPDAPAEPALAPRSQPGKFQAEKKSKKKDRKAPKPDPTQPDGNQ